METDLPPEAVTAAYAEFRDLYPQRMATWDELARWEQERWERIITAAAPAIRAPLITEHLAGQDAVHADLALLLRTLGMFDGARPQSPHEVMLEAIGEAGKMRAGAAGRERLRSCQRVALARLRLANAAGHPDPDGVISSLRAVLEVIDG